MSDTISVIDQFRGLARPPFSGLSTKVDLYLVARQVMRAFGEVAERAMIRLDAEGLDGLPRLEGEHGEIEQMFFILIQNAIQAADGQAWRDLVITGTAQEDSIELLFEDTCGGIAPENIGKVFEPFFTTKPRGQGTGLGLCIVHRLLEGYGGTIDVKSVWGEGTTFRIRLPLRMET